MSNQGKRIAEKPTPPECPVCSGYEPEDGVCGWCNGSGSFEPKTIEKFAWEIHDQLRSLQEDKARLEAQVKHLIQYSQAVERTNAAMSKSTPQRKETV